MGFKDYLEEKRKEEKKKSSSKTSSSSSGGFREYLKTVNDPNNRIDVGSSDLTEDEVSKWSNSVGDVGKRVYKYLTTEGYKKADASLIDELDKYLTDSVSIRRYLKANKSKIKDYESVYETYTQSVKYLKDLKNSLKDSNEIFSQFETENEYNDALKVSELYGMSTEEIEPYLDTSKADAEKSALAKRQKELQEQLKKTSTKGKGATKRNELQKELNEINKQIEQLDKTSNVAYTTLEGEDITWKSLYASKKREEELQGLINSASGSADFEEYAKKGGDIVNPTMAEAEGYAKIFGWRPGAKDVGNIVTYSREHAAEIQIGELNNASDLIGDPIYLQMTDDEVKVYNYYLAKDMENGTNNADKYLDSMQETLNTRLGTKMANSLKGKTALEVLFGISAGLDQYVQGTKNAFNFTDDYIPYSPTQVAAGYVREDLEDNPIGKVAYDVVQTTSNMAPSMAASFLPGGQVLTAVSVGLSASGNSYQDALNRGYGKGEARTYATLNGLSESTLTYLLGGIGKGAGKLTGKSISKLTANISSANLRIAANLGIRGLGEGVEEYLQDAVIEPVLSNAILNTNKKIDLLSEDALYSGFLGAMSSLVLGVPGEFGSAINTRRQGKEVIQKGKVNELVDFGKSLSADTVANKIANKVNEKTGAYTIGRLLQEAGAESLSATNMADIEKSLVRKGVTEKDAKNISAWLNKAVEGGNFTKSQIDALENNEVISQTFKDVIFNQKSTVNQRNQEYNSLLGLANEVANYEAPTKEQISDNINESIAQKNAIRQEIAPTFGTTALPTEVTENMNRMVAEKSKITSNDTNIKTNYTVSEDGKTTNTATGEAITINKNNAIAKTETVDGERVVYLNTDKGVVSSKEVNYASESEALVYESFVDLNPAFANAVIKNYDGKVDAQTYVKGMREGIVLYGMHNFQGVGKDISKNSFLAELSETDQAFALKLGRAYAESVAKKEGKALRKAIKNAAEKAEANKDTSTKATAKKGKVSFESGVVAKGKLQKRAVALAKHLSRAIGIDIVFYDARTTADPNGKGANGYYDVDTDTIHLDLQNSVDDAKTIAYTLSHELVHFIKKWSPEKYNTFAKFLMEQYAKHDVNTSQLLANKMANLGTKDADLAYEEMIADACETMLLDSNAVYKLMELRKTDLDLFEKIKLHIHELLNKIRNMYKKLGLQPTSDEAKALLKMEDSLEQMYSLFEDAAVDAAQTYQAAQNANETIFGETSVDVGKTESGVKNQLKNHKKIGEDATAYNDRHKKVHNAILKVGIESMYEMAETMLPYLNQEGILPPDIPGKTIFKNGSYGRTGENTTLCVRTLTYEDFKNRVAEEVGRPLTVSESLLVSQKIYDIATDPQCIYCYVAADRKAYDDYLGEYWKAMDKYIKAMRKGGDSKTLYTEYLAGRKDTDAQKKRWSQWEAIAKNGKDYISAKDLTTKNKRDALIAKKNAFSEQIKDAQRYAQSASWAKTVFDYRAYKGDILKMTSKFVDMLNSEYGLRMYSFSDYTPAFIVENMQMLIDASVKGLKSLAYTKDTDYAEIFASTGQAINVSCFAKWDAKSGTFVEDNRQGANWAKTQSLRKQYRNVGAVMVATNDAMVEWALKQDWVDVVIPYHIVKTGTTIANEYQWNNYTSESSDRVGNKTANIYPTEHNNDFATYSNLLNERGITPRFSRWYDMVESGKLTEEQYMKLVNEVRLPASELSAVVPSFNLDAAKKSFGIDTEGNVIEGGFVDKGGYMGGWYRQGVDVNQEVMAVSEDIKAGKSSLDVDYGMNKAAKEKAEARYKKQAKKSMTVEEKRSGTELANFIDAVSNMIDQSKVSKRKLKIGEISDVHRKTIEEIMKTIYPNFSAEGYELWIDGTGAEHINIRHGENGKADKTMASREDRELIPWVANSPDGGEFIREESGKLKLSNRFFNLDGSKAPQIRLHKIVDGDTIYVSECVPDSKHKRVYITSAYKKSNTNQLLNIDSNESPQLTPEATFDSGVTEDIIHQEGAESQEKTVKKQLKKDSSSYAPTFYSQMGKVVDGIKMEKIGADSVLNYMKGKVKKDEIKWSGIETFLEGKKSVTKQELQEFIAGSQLQIEVQEQSDSRFERYTLDGGENYREILFKMPNASYTNTAMKNHWGEDAEGVLAHARIQDFNVDGKKMLFIEEIQSDWHNEGHKNGYTDNETLTKVRDADKTIREQIEADPRMRSIIKNIGIESFVERMQTFTDNSNTTAEGAWEYFEFDDSSLFKGKTKKAVMEYFDKFRELRQTPALDAPFKENYHEYVLKNLLRMAAENGYDSIGWTPAEVQSERWSDEFAEGYRIEYDQDIPKFLKKYGKQWGATVGKSQVSSPVTDSDIESRALEILSEKGIVQFHWNWSHEYGLAYEQAKEEMSQQGKSVEVWSMDITEPMEQAVLYEGQAKFQKKQVSNRTILSNALESAIDTSTQAGQNELKVLKDYQAKIDSIEKEEARLAEVNAEIKKISFGKDTDRSKLNDLKVEKTKTQNRINLYDKQLVRLEAMKPIQDILTREKEIVRKRTEAKGKEALAAYRKEAIKVRNHMIGEARKETRQKISEARSRTEMRHKIKRVVGDLNKLLLNPSKERHVPEEMRIAVAEALNVINMDTVDAETRAAKYNNLIAKAKDPDVIASLTETRDRILKQGEKLADKLTKLKDAYSMVRDSADDSLRSMYDDVIYNKIESVQKSVGKTPLRNMTLGQLESVHDLYTMVLTTVRDSNKAFAEDLKMSRLALGSNTFAEIKENNKTKDTIKHPSLGKFLWQNLKPMQAMKTIGSGTLQKLWNNILYGQEVFAKDFDEAVKFADEMKEKYGYKKWKLDKVYSFESKSGKTMKLNLEQMMSIYAYSKRPQADEHIEYGGIVLNEGVVKVKNKLGKTVEVKVNDSSAHRLDKMQVGEIVATLEEEAPGAKKFVDEMQKYLSETMGEKGNEVAMKMYGIKLFKEEHYFPLKSSKDFMEAANAKLKGDVKIKNKGMTKSTVEHARNPIVLENFLDVWGNHINEMAMYHGLVLPLEDFSRTLNYSFKADDTLNTDAESVRTALHDAFGENADNYLNELLKAINGGVLHDSSTQFADKMISKFKKAKVMASLSVIVQQPTAIIRAMGIIEPKYFVAQNFHHKSTWEELKNYCPTAIIKEAGSFDTNMGRTIVDMIKDERGFTDKVGDFLGKAPAYMDEMGWNMIWRALKKKVAAEQKLSGEALLKECGKQMALIINETQVYDSVMSRNELMRSKSAFTKMATAFMAEPSTVANMIYGAGLDFKRGKKGVATKTVAAVVSSVVINGLVSAMVYALRDDDEEKTLLEKYLSSATSEVLDGINPLTYIPFVKDAYSLFQGYKVERTDMALISDVVDAVNDFYNVLDPEAYEDMSREEIAKHIYENSVPMLTSICDMFGLPVGNVLRDAEAIIINDNVSLSQTSSKGIGHAFKEGSMSVLPKFVQNIIGIDSKQDKLYDAIVDGDTAYVNRLKSTYKDDKAYTQAVRKVLRDNDPRIKEAAEARLNGDMTRYKELAYEIKGEGHFVQDDIVAAIMTEYNTLKSANKEESSSSKSPEMYNYTDYYNAVINGDSYDVEAVRDYLIESGKTEDDIESNLNSNVKDAYKNGELSASEAKSLMVSYGGKTKDEADIAIRYVDFKVDYPEYKEIITESKFKNYYKPMEDYRGRSVADTGLSISAYAKYCEKSAECKGTDADKDGKTDSGSKKAQVLRVINSLPISSAQKDALYYLNGWAKSKLNEAPWH